jgi:hypothetical protein
MSPARLARAVAGPVVVACALGLGGCGGVQPPAPPARSAPAAPTPSADPLAAVEAELDAVERAVDADVGTAAGR